MTCPTWTGLPRARGDRPTTTPASRYLSAAPPRPRGSTHIPQIPSPIDLGSPAPAGIDPFDDAARTLNTWLPRARGDRPWNKA